MTVLSETVFDDDGTYLGTRLFIRDDAIEHDGRYRVPITATTKFVHTWQEFRDAKGQIVFNEDQTEITLRLPEPYMFGCGFQRAPAEDAQKEAA